MYIGNPKHSIMSHSGAFRAWQILKKTSNVLVPEFCDNEAMPYNVCCDATADGGLEQK